MIRKCRGRSPALREYRCSCPARHTRRTKIFLVIALLALVPCSAFPSGDGFFSAGRFRIRTGIADRIPPGSGEAQAEIKTFAELFSKAVEEAERGDDAAAERDLKEARRVWPEFYATDFVLALIFEKDRPGLAARYYKSYLVKLKAYNEDNDSISAPLIRSLLGPDTEHYEKARALVRDRVLRYGINIEDVREPDPFPPYVYAAAAAVPLAVLLGFLFSAAMSRARKLYRAAHPPEGFWVCPRCGTENPAPNMVCQECGKGRMAQSAKR